MLIKLLLLLYLTKHSYSSISLDRLGEKSKPIYGNICRCSSALQKPRVYKGIPVIGFDFFWVVALYSKSEDSVICTGSLLSDSTVLIAAHCLDDEELDDLFVLAGFVYNWRVMKDTDWGSRKVSKIIKYPNYDKNLPNYPKANDIAILELEKKFLLGFNNSITLACILNKEIKEPNALDYYFAGYGLTYPYLLYQNQSHTPFFETKGLNHIKLKYVPEACNRKKLHKAFLCTKNDEGSLCNVDSGGGLYTFVGEKLVLVSVQSSIKTKKIFKNRVSYRCKKGTVSLSVKISNYLDFIIEKGKPQCLIEDFNS